jgi:MoxR-like ATPase
LATQNPIEQEGTYPLPEAQLDRFMFSIKLDYPSFAEEVPMLHRKELGPLQLNIGERPPVNSLPKMAQLPTSDRK